MKRSLLPIFAALLLITLALTLTLTSCKRQSDTPKEPWIFTSEKAPYSLTLPPSWQLEENAAINSHADFTASRDDQFFMLVIPQELPEFPVPDSEAVKVVSLERMEEKLDNFSVSREGPVQLDGHDGVAVFFQGYVQEHPIHYIATYITHGGWAYQVIAWAPTQLEHELATEIDQILVNWKFNTSLAANDKADAVHMPPANVIDTDNAAESE